MTRKLWQKVLQPALVTYLRSPMRAIGRSNNDKTKLSTIYLPQKRGSLDIQLELHKRTTIGNSRNWFERNFKYRKCESLAISGGSDERRLSERPSLRINNKTISIYHQIALTKTMCLSSSHLSSVTIVPISGGNLDRLRCAKFKLTDPFARSSSNMRATAAAASSPFGLSRSGGISSVLADFACV